MRRSDHRDNGSVLIIVMWVSLGLVSLALMFGQSAMLEYRGRDNALAGAQAEQALEGARRYVAYALANNEQPGILPNEDTTLQAEGIAVGDANFWLLGRPTTVNRSNNEMAFGLIDEAAKLNLNSAPLAMLQLLPKMTPELAAAIVDWRDSNLDTTPNGAESDYYSQSSQSYEAKNAPFDSIDELRLLRGATPELLDGEDLNRNGMLDPNENDGDVSPPVDNADGRLDFGILEYVTVYSREPNVRPDGSARVNIRQGQEMSQLLTETFGESRAREMQTLSGTNLANVRSTLEYFYMTRMTPEEFAQIDDLITLSNDEYTTGLVDVNTAPREVLVCIPGIGEQFADTIAGERSSRSQTDLQSTAWLSLVLKQENVLAAAPFITARASQVTADIAAVGRHGRGLRRARYVFDVKGGTVRVAYRQDLSGLGWPLGAAIRENLQNGNDER